MAAGMVKRLREFEAAGEWSALPNRKLKTYATTSPVFHRLLMNRFTLARGLLVLAILLHVTALFCTWEVNDFSRHSSVHSLTPTPTTMAWLVLNEVPEDFLTPVNPYRHEAVERYKVDNAVAMGASTTLFLLAAPLLVRFLARRPPLLWTTRFLVAMLVWWIARFPFGNRPFAVGPPAIGYWLFLASFLIQFLGLIATPSSLMPNRWCLARLLPILACIVAVPALWLPWGSWPTIFGSIEVTLKVDLQQIWMTGASFMPSALSSYSTYQLVKVGLLILFPSVYLLLISTPWLTAIYARSRLIRGLSMGLTVGLLAMAFMSSEWQILRSAKGFWFLAAALMLQLAGLILLPSIAKNPFAPPTTPEI